LLKRTEGIVIKGFPYGEADLIVTYLTRDYGLVRAFAKSPRKIKSRFGSSLEPLTYARISLMGREDAALPRLTQSDIIRPFQPLRESYDCFVRISAMLELTLNLIPEGEPNRAAFELLLQALTMMERDCSGLYALTYRVKLLGLAGYSPRLKGCARCGKAGKKFYVSHGSIICEQCSSEANYVERKDFRPLSEGSIRLYETLLTWNLEKLPRVKAPEGLVREISGLLDSHVEYALSKPIKTKGPA